MQLPTISKALILLASASPLILANPLPEPEPATLEARTNIWAFKTFPDTACSQNATYTGAGTANTTCVSLTTAQQGVAVEFSAGNTNFVGTFYTGASCSGKSYSLPYNTPSTCTKAITSSGAQGKFVSYKVTGAST